jgi:2,3-bisphosphoglycerate-independent phosphoglycerate mutase
MNDQTLPTLPEQQTIELPPDFVATKAQVPPQTEQAPQQTQPRLEPIISRQPFAESTQFETYSGPKPVVLLVLDGWGIGPDNPGNAIKKAHTPNIDRYWLTFPHTQLSASGEAVGLPRGEDGNTETGHLNIGAGHIVYQDLPRINMAIADGTFGTTSAFLNAIEHAKRNNSTLHLMGLIGAGGVHSNIEHLYALLNLCKQQQLEKVYIHGFTDGRDSPPTSGINYVQQIMERCTQLGVGKLASLMGRYYAMDRDHRWERIEKAYNALTQAKGETCILDPIQILKSQYDAGVTDEFIEPINICDKDGSHRVIQDNDAVIFFNYRIDRPRELTRAFVQVDFEQGISNQAFDPYTEKYKKTNIQEQTHVTTFKRAVVLKNLYFVTMTRYEEALQTDVAFPPQNIKNPLCKVISQHGLRQLRITETEKERFVTYYMNGQAEAMYPGEDRVIIPSKGVKSYDQAPEMSAHEIASEMISRIRANTFDVIISNICNGDMVGHTGNFDAAVTACGIVDTVVGQIVSEVYARGGVVLITADHGNVEEMLNTSSGEIDTEHSTYPVPLLIIGKKFANKPSMLASGILADVAPTMLSILGIKRPDSMTGRALV